MKYLYLLRHGETLFNQLKKVQGSCDSPLTDLGRQQASWARKYFEINQIELDHAYSSTQERASDTLEIITSLPYERKKGLKEFAFGRFEGEPAALQPKGTHHFESFYLDYGGEAAESVRQRMLSTLTDIMNQDDHEHVLAVSHNGAVYYFLSQIWKESNGQQPRQLPNCCIIRLSYSDNQFDVLDVIDPAQFKGL